MGLCVASISLRYVAPIPNIFIGAPILSMLRICIADVCVRMTLPFSRKNVSCISRAGWYSGVFNAVKLCQSSSTSGPVHISYPNDSSIADISDKAWVNGCNVPRFSGSISSDGSNRWAANAACIAAFSNSVWRNLNNSRSAAFSRFNFARASLSRFFIFFNFAVIVPFFPNVAVYNACNSSSVFIFFICSCITISPY